MCSQPLKQYRHSSPNPGNESTGAMGVGTLSLWSVTGIQQVKEKERLKYSKEKVKQFETLDSELFAPI